MGKTPEGIHAIDSLGSLVSVSIPLGRCITLLKLWPVNPFPNSFELHP
jgi:hypothetical protein